MELNEYQRLALKTSGAFKGQERKTMNLLALSGEVGELCNLYKKALGHGHNITQDQFADELGDILWYVSELADAFDLTLDGIAQQNIEKLRARYPNGFSHERSRERS